MLFYLKLYLLTLPVFFVIDMLWLGVIARAFYRDSLGHLLAERVDWAAAIIFYLIYIAGILVFAVAPGLAADSLRKTILLAAGFGFFTYATYELTNRATLPDWPLKIVVVDTAWGVVLCCLVAMAAHLIGKWLH
ncbi:MAG: DUF2177 family protein [Halochromatium sp.]|uniref:DUF2177 family protein n=1 Tax=Halochromatium sp. TaxID=2049430 RepID=UPI00397B8367